MAVCKNIDAPPYLKRSESYGNREERVKEGQKRFSLHLYMDGPAIYIYLEPKTQSSSQQLGMNVNS